MLVLLDRAGAWALRTIRSLGYGVAGNAVVMLAVVAVDTVFAVGIFQAVRALGAGPFSAVVMLPFFVTPLVVLSRMLRLAERVAKAVTEHNFEEAARVRRLIDGDGPPRNPCERAVRALGEAEGLLGQERWAEARDLFATIQIEELLELVQPGTASEHGYATAHAGQPALGIEQIERGIAVAERQKKYPLAKRWYLFYRLGVALSLAGRHEEAVDVLDSVLSDLEHGDAYAWTEAMFFLGQSHRGVGAADVAAEILELGAEQGRGPFAARARAALEEAKRMPHRGGGAAHEVRVALDDERSETRSPGEDQGWRDPAPGTRSSR